MDAELRSQLKVRGIDAEVVENMNTCKYCGQDTSDPNCSCKNCIPKISMSTGRNKGRKARTVGVAENDLDMMDGIERNQDDGWFYDDEENEG